MRNATDALCRQEPFTKYVGAWELPALGAVTALTAVLIRPDGCVAWVRDQTQRGLTDALTTWFGSPTVSLQRLVRWRSVTWCDVLAPRSEAPPCRSCRL